MLYIVQATGTDYYKIGFTENRPEARLKELQTGCPYKLRVVHIFQGSMDDEASLHRAFQPYRSREKSEWFKLDMASMFALIANSVLGQRIDYRKEVKDISDFLKGFRVSSKKPNNPSVDTPIEKLYSLYVEWCDIKGYRKKELQYFTKDMKRLTNIGYKKMEGTLFFSMIPKEDIDF